MKNRIKILLALLAAAMTFCPKPEPKLVPADAKLLTKPIDQISKADIKRMRVLVKTDYGNFIVGFYPDQAPLLCKNFIQLVRQGFYSGLHFHMIIPRYMIIGGDPKGDGTGGPGYWLKPEYNSLPHVRGAFGMSHPPFSPSDIGSQFYVMLTNSMRESNAYPVFGYVEKGMDVCDRIGEIPSSGVEGKPPWKPQTLITIQEMKLLVLESK